MISVLIVEDEEEISKLIKSHINQELGINIIFEVKNIQEAMKIVKQKYPDIVITDLKIPIIDGLELIEEALRYNQNLITIMVTACRKFEYAQRAIRLGVSDYLLKPIKKNEMKDALEKAIMKVKERRIKYEISHKEELSKTLMEQIALYIKENLSDQELCLTKVAAQFYLSPSYLSRLIKGEIGESFIGYLTNIRLDTAIWYLENTDKKAYEIAELVGIVDATYFSKYFKKNKGISIGDYRKAIKRYNHCRQIK